MEITQQIREYAAQLGVDVESAKARGMNDMAEKFLEEGAELYQEQ